jgi:Protein of unknown function (DUF4235)
MVDVGPSEKLVWKIYVGVVGAITTIVAQKLLTKAWEIATGEEPPSPTDPDTPVFAALTWAFASGVGVGVTQLMTKRVLAKRRAGQLGVKPDPGKIKVAV